MEADQMGGSPQRNSPFLLATLGKISNLIEIGCSVAATVLHLFFLCGSALASYLSLPFPCLYSNERNDYSFKKNQKNYKVVLHFASNKKL